MVDSVAYEYRSLMTLPLDSNLIRPA